MITEIKILRENKGKSLLNLPSNYIVIDIETTGFDTVHDTILEIGAIKVENENVTDEFHTLIKTNDAIPEFIVELTGITDELVKSGDTIENTLNNFKDFIGNEILIGHNVNFDINFLYDNFEKYNIGILSNDYVDTMRLSRRINPDLKHHRLCDLEKLYKIPVDESHRALADTYTTNEAYKYLKKDILEKFENEDNFIKMCKKHNSIKSYAKDIVATEDDINPDNPFYGKECVFTGTLERMVRKDAMQTIVNLGGTNRDTVTNDTNYLILGNFLYQNVKDGKSSKQLKAEKYKLKGNDIEIISENTFYDMINDYTNN